MSHSRTIQITRADQAANPYFYIPFDVPEGTSRIDVSMRYPKADDCVIDLGVLDPRITDYPAEEGFRGWSGGARDSFFVARDDATPGYIHGEIQPGRWQVILGLYKVPEAGAEVTITYALDDAPRPLVGQPERTYPVRPGAGWYRGDLHTHTHHSDARGAPELLHAAAKQAGLDFLAVADHNTITQRRYFHPHSSPDLVFVRGMEVTTATGHANVFGVDDWIDFRMTRPEHAHVLADAVHKRGGLLSINHDKPTIPWDYELPQADLQEVWQTAWLAYNWISLARYQQRLASGLRISAIGGSDFHQPDRLMPEGPFVVGRPTTVLELPELSEDAILAAMKAGRGYVTESPTGPHLAITIGETPMGGAVPAGAIEAKAEVRDAAGDRLVWVDATGTLAEEIIGSEDWVGSYRGIPSMFLRAEIVAVASHDRIFAETQGARVHISDADLIDFEGQPIRRALSNPIYINS
ncbi:phosphoesterase [Youhaiella tibetensis]|uniref:PHP domain-containing protein n=1 Tax=Paradevosia tibetensis TaxID=1447062 RepID=A0A5B9DNQ5_9HYPH|nr:CehA/McbA family metallohydrolase [Youhaiella tibetensis]QEE20763.1 PHP domain-containing protein [Youhaiella tibetensis]GGF21179.1 phosphoesterase [Youhaiella tibetensis]